MFEEDSLLVLETLFELDSLLELELLLEDDPLEEAGEDSLAAGAPLELTALFSSVVGTKVVTKFSVT